MMRIRGTGKRPIRVSELIEHYGEVFPDPGIVYGIQAPCVPGPPLLDPHNTQDANASVVVQAVRCVGRVYGSPGRGAPQHSLEILAFNAVPFMLKGNIAPIAWVAFSYETWMYARSNAASLGGWDATPSKNVARASKMPAKPPIAWILSVKRFAARASFFGWFEEKFRTRPVLRSKKLSNLLKKYDHMVADIQSVPIEDVTRDFVEEAVECNFPNESFTRCVKEARAECDKMREKLNEQIRDGVWVW